MPPAKLPFLDGLRGLMALWVLISHAMLLCRWGMPIVEEGLWAVDVFIILSGFLMTYHYYERQGKEPWESGETVKKFYIRRFFRIAPLYYLLLIPAFLFAPMLVEMREAALAPFEPIIRGNWNLVDKAKFDWLNVVSHFTFVFGMIPYYVFGTALPDWSISLEMQYYAVFPVLMLLLRRVNPIIFTGLMYGAGLVGRKLFDTSFYLKSFLPLKIEIFLIGMILAILFFDKKAGNWIKGAITLAACMIASRKTPIVLPVFLLMAGLIAHKTKGRFKGLGWINEALSGSGAELLGRLSYSAYLLHFLILIPLAAWLSSFPFYVSAEGPQRFLILFGLSIGPIYLISYFLYEWVEKPGIRFGKTLMTKS